MADQQDGKTTATSAGADSSPSLAAGAAAARPTGDCERGGATSTSAGGRANQTAHDQRRESGTIWAEHDVHAAPQVTGGEGPEAVNGDGAVDFEADIQAPMAADDKSTIAEKRPWWRRLRSWNWKIIVPFIIIIVLVIVVPIVAVYTKKKPDQEESSGESTPGETPSLTSSPSSPTTGPATETNGSSSTTASSSPTSTSSPVSHLSHLLRSASTASIDLARGASDADNCSFPCVASQIPECDSSDFKSGVHWIGIANGADWTFDLGSASGAEDCCRQCYQDFEECNGWLYMPGNSTSSVPPCNIITGYQGPDSDRTCPEGKPDIVFAGGRSDSEDNFGGGGPCARNVRGG